MPRPGRTGLLPTRAKRALAFIAIVWAVAGSYVAFEVASSGGTDLMLSHPELFGDLLLSRATTRATTCVVAAGESARAAAGGVSAAEAHAASWLLGISLGSDAVVRQLRTADLQALEAIAAHRSQVGEALGVPAPVVFVPRQVVNAHREFAQFVEADVRATAHQLAVRYSPQACELYKLGAFWAYSAAVRVMLPDQRATYDAEIRHYARKAALPEPLWQPMVEPPPAANGAERAANNEAVTAGITKYLMTRP
jgi:hypothetical protein